MIQTGISRADGIRIAIFAVVYLLFGLLMPIQGYVTAEFAVGTAVVAVLYGLVLYYLNTGIPLGRKARILITWLAVYVVQMLNPVLEGVFFSTLFEGHPESVFGAIVFGLVLTLPTAVAAGLLFKPSGEIKSFAELRRDYFSATRWPQFVARFVVASVLWMAIYFLFGSIVGPIVSPYYTEGGVGYELVIPPVGILILLQTLRGFIYALGILPIVLSTRFSRTRLAGVLAGLLYVGGALAIFVISAQFPVFLRVVHGLELFADSLFAGVVIAYILGRRIRPVVQAA